MATAKDVINDIRSLANPRKAKDLQSFFKTGPSEYAEGDIFLGVMVPQSRAVAKRYRDLAISEIKKLTKSDFHEIRFCGLLILVSQFERAKTRSVQKELFDFYIQQLKLGYINNWDLVDVTGVRMGKFLLDQKGSLTFLKKLARRENLWERRASIIFTFSFQHYGDPYPTLEIADILLKDEHDLIHKAVGWALREVGKKDVTSLRKFLNENASLMPRTMLRYAIEKLPETERKKWIETSK